MLTIVLVLFAVFVCGDVILTGVSDDKKVAWPILGAILNTFVSGLVGFANDGEHLTRSANGLYFG